MDFSQRLQTVNDRLKAGKIKVRIEQMGDRLVLRATLPSRTGGQPCQQRVFTGLTATPIGLQEAERRARQLRVDLDSGRFDWGEWSKGERFTGTVGEWVARFEVDYFARRNRSPKTESTWSSNYWSVFRKLPQDVLLTPALLTTVLLETVPDSSMRALSSMALGSLAKFAGLDIDLKRFKGSYQSGQIKRDLPDDRLIVEKFDLVLSPGWKWVYGVLACYGLRPHEVFYADISDNRTLWVAEGKTGARRVWPFPGEWFDLFDLGDKILPRYSGKNNRECGQKVSRAFYRYGIGFAPYDLRHAWAIRTLKTGLDLTLAARQMGHSVLVHSKTYHRWITDREHQEAYDKLNPFTDDVPK